MDIFKENLDIFFIMFLTMLLMLYCASLINISSYKKELHRSLLGVWGGGGRGAKTALSLRCNGKNLYFRLNFS